MISPALYEFSIASTSFSACSNIAFLVGGICKSSIPTLIPASVA